MFPQTFSLSNLDGTNGFIITGTATQDSSGYFVSSAGDINADNITDLVIGAPPLTYNVGPDAGKCFVVFGGVNVGKNGMIALTNLNGTNGFVITGEANDNVGYSVSSAGDINSDGKTDLIIGAPYANSAAGKSYIVFGSANVGMNGTLLLSSLTGTNGFVITGEVAGDRSGGSVSFAGDINQDGKNDLLIGAYGAGFTYVVFGGASVGSSGTLALSSLTGTNGFTIIGESGDDACGASVAAAGDVNGDGKADLIIGAPLASVSGIGVGVGKSYVVFGGSNIGSSGTFSLSTLTGTNGFIIPGEAWYGGASGQSVAGVGDINHDGKDDVMIGAFRVSNSGTSYVVFGGSGVGSSGTFALSSLNGTNGFKLVGEASGDYCGIPVASAGDINGDNKTDLLIGAYGANSLTGKSYVLFGGLDIGSNGTFALANLNGTNGFKITGQRLGDHSGFSGSSAGDVNGDGKVDLIIGAPYANVGLATQAGKSYVIFGGGFSPSSSPSRSPSLTSSISVSASTTGSSSFTTTQSISYSRSLSRSVSPSFSVTGSLSGSITTTPTVSVTSGLTPTQSPSQSSSASPTLSITRSPTSSIAPFPATFNLANLDGTNGFKIIGENPYDLSGYSVSSAGDIDGDGIVDLIIGAPNYLTPGSDKSYVVFGASNIGRSGIFMLSSLNGTNGFKIMGLGTTEHSGYSVSSVGDINGDGKTDIIIGAPNANQSTGKSYVVFGGSNVGINGTLLLSNLNGSNGFVIIGESAGDESGISVSSAGDINSDGKADLIIGAYYANGAMEHSGKSYVVFGGTDVGSNGTLALSSLNGANGFKIIGAVGLDESGLSVSNAGDINEDGNTDLIIGAPNANLSGGKSQVVFGGFGVGNTSTLALSNLNGNNGFTITGEAPNDRSGYSVNAAGDVNDDDIPDLIIGAYGANSFAGKSYVVFGSSGIGSSGALALSSLTGTNGFKITGEAAYDGSGLSVSFAGDVNSDGIADVIIGAVSATGDVTSSGASYVIFGGENIASTGALALSDLNGANGFVMLGEAAGDKVGYSVSSAGDINNDGKADLIIGAPYAGSTAGKSYVVFGGGFPGSSSASVSQSKTSSTSVSISATTSGSVSATQSTSYSRSLSPSISLSPSATVSISNSRTLTPTISATSGLTATQSPSQSSSVTPSIASFPATFYLADLDGTNGFKIIGDTPYGECGYSVSSAGDINGDGIMDIIIGAPYYLTPGLDKSYVIFGGSNLGRNGTLMLSSLNGANGFSIIGTETTEHSGISVAAAGDINGDGNADLIIGAYGANSYTGKSYVVFGGAGVGSNGTLILSSLNGRNGFVIMGEVAGDDSGVSVSSAGDVNGDGKDDLIIGAYGAASQAGKSYVVFGGTHVGSNGTLTLSSLNGANGFKITGESGGDRFGASVSFAGDINDDGNADLIIGAYGANVSGGTSYVIFGGVGIGSGGTLALFSLNGANGFKITGEAPYDYSGGSVSAAGDINGDGKADLIIGAFGANSDIGKSYVVFGGAGIGNTGSLPLFSLNGSNGFKLMGEAIYDFSGASVSAAGDINGDGIADLIIAAPYAVSEADTGKSYVVFGGGSVGNSGTLALSNLNGNNGFTLIGEAIHDFSGASVASVGDVNDDGKNDLIIGAPFANSYTGKSYVVFGGGFPVSHSASVSLTPSLTSSATVSSSVSSSFSATDSVSPTVTSSSSASASTTISSSVTSSLTLSSSISPSPTTTSSISTSQSFSSSMTPTISSSDSVTASTSFGTTLSPTTSISPTISITPSLSSSPSQTPTPSVTQGLTPTQSPTLSLTSSITPTLSLTSSATASITTTTSPSPTPYPAPTIISNFLNIGQGQTVIILPANLGIAASPANPQNILVTVSNIQYGQFERSSIPGIAITTFNYQELTQGIIRFIHDGTPNAPSYDVQVSAATYLPPAQPAQIIFNHTPVLWTNTLTILPGQSVVLSSQNLNATDVETPPQLLTFEISNVVSGKFTDNTKPSGTAITRFKQGQVLNGDIVFTAANSLAVPQYAVSVSDGILMTFPPAFAEINYNPQLNTVSTTSQQTTEDIIRKALISFSVTGSLGLVLFLLKIYLGRKLNSTVDKRLNEKSAERNDALKNVIKPIAKKIFDQIKISGFLGCIGDQKVNAYIDAVEVLLERLHGQMIDDEHVVRLDLSSLPAAERQRYQTQLNHLIAIQIRRALVPPRSVCSTATCARFFRADVTPIQFEDAIPRIVPAILEAIQSSPELLEAMQRVSTAAAETNIPEELLTDLPEAADAAEDYDADCIAMMDLAREAGDDELADIGVPDPRGWNRNRFFTQEATTASPLKQTVTTLVKRTREMEAHAKRMESELREMKQRLLSPPESQVDFTAQGFGA